jgi:hypothetical protein
MSRKTKHKTKAQPSAAARRPPWWIAGVIFVAVVAMAGYWMWGKYAAPSGPDTSKLIGQWQRPDGGYVLEVREATPDGLLKAAYFNPRSINVARADWRLQDSRLQVFVELRDVNYPGSTYTLSYDPAADQLKGIYFQAVEQQSFEVFFVRANAK